MDQPRLHLVRLNVARLRAPFGDPPACPVARRSSPPGAAGRDAPVIAREHYGADHPVNQPAATA